MKCQVCGAESGKYPLCKSCNAKKENGEIIKCESCGNWHYKGAPCKSIEEINFENYLYSARTRLISENESRFFGAISAALPNGYHVFPQINLATFIERNDSARFRNELFRNVDFLITDSDYSPKIAIEINDSSHFERDRRERDEKVHRICEEAGIPIINLWTSYGVQPDYIQKRISEQLAALPAKRVHHFNVQDDPPALTDDTTVPAKKKGCYIATSVYGSYDCPEVRVMRRFRDEKLDACLPGKLFIKVYYALSPTAVRLFGKSSWFNKFWKLVLDKFVENLRRSGISDSDYKDS